MPKSSADTSLAEVLMPPGDEESHPFLSLVRILSGYMTQLPYYAGVAEQYVTKDEPP